MPQEYWHLQNLSAFCVSSKLHLAINCTTSSEWEEANDTKKELGCEQSQGLLGILSLKSAIQQE